MNKDINDLLIQLGDLKPEAETYLKITGDMQLNPENQLEGILYFCVSKGVLSLDEIKTKYPEEIVNGVVILDKLEHINYSMQKEEAENLRRLFFATTKDIRIIMLKIAEIVTEIRHQDIPEDKNAFVNSILFLYAPLSARLGLSKYKTELENSAFKISNPEKYEEIQNEVDARYHKRQPIVDRLVTLVENCMKELDIEGKVYGRKKHIYSIYKKLQDHTFDDIYDLIAVRAIVKSIPECYALIGKLHAVVEPYKNRFKDYISNPKPNGYQSIHSTVIFEGFPVEIQIRTEEMHKYAEYGIAAHWLYKEKAKQGLLDVRLSWIRQMIDNEEVSIDELASSLDQDLYNSEIYVQTPKGKVVYLPKGSTPIDFAYAIHSEVGNKCVGAKINGKMASTTTPLNSADVVEIITNPNSKGPSRDWLKIVKTSEARNKINTFFKKNMREETIALGKSMLDNAIKEKGYSVAKLTGQKQFEEILEYYHRVDLDDFYINIGTNAISAKLVANKLAQAYQKQVKQESAIVPTNNSVTITSPSEKTVELKGLNNILLKFANCCHPMYGDNIIGFVSAGRGVIIHRAECPNVASFSHKRLIEVAWKPLVE